MNSEQVQHAIRHQLSLETHKNVSHGNMVTEHGNEYRGSGLALIRRGVKNSAHYVPVRRFFLRRNTLCGKLLNDSSKKPV